MKIIQKCSVCGTECESYNDWESLEEFFQTNLDEPEFEHDEGNRDCGGLLEYEEEEIDVSGLSHEEKMQKAWDFIHNSGITDDKEEYEAAPESFWLVKDLYEVRDAFYDDLENGIGDDDNGLTEFFERHKIDHK